MSDDQTAVSDLLEDNQYKYGFTTDVESETFAKGLNEEVVRAISKKKNEPEFMLNFRLKAFEKWKTMKEPAWPNVNYPPIDFQDISYYSAPKKRNNCKVWMRSTRKLCVHLKSWVSPWMSKRSSLMLRWMLFSIVSALLPRTRKNLWSRESFFVPYLKPFRITRNLLKNTWVPWFQ